MRRRNFVRLPLLFVVLTAAHVEPPKAAQLFAQGRLPIIDMHLHAQPADAQGPPPLAICAPFERFPAWDPSQPYAPMRTEVPPCSDQVWSLETDEEVMNQTIATMERWNRSVC